MRSIIFISFLFIAAIKIAAQDTLYLRSKKINSVKVIEINDTSVLYTPFPYNGSKPIEINIAELQKIKFENGKIQLFKIRSPKVRNVFVIGGIPIQLASRSYGGYVGYEYKRLMIDYRYTYTYKFPTFGGLLSSFNERQYYHGDNNSLVVSYLIAKKQAVGLLIGYKHWWFSDEIFSKNGLPPQSSYSQNQYRSSNIKGLNFGAEYSYDFSNDPLQGIFYINCSYTLFKGTSSTKSSQTIYSKYEEYDVQPFFIHMAIGLKFGAKIRVCGSCKNLNFFNAYSW